METTVGPKFFEELELFLIQDQIKSSKLYIAELNKKLTTEICPDLIFKLSRECEITEFKLEQLEDQLSNLTF